MFELKPLSEAAVPDALDKAVRYRLLNEPVEAESICLDVLEVDPDNEKALITLLLALTDQFPARLGAAVKEALAIVPRLEDEYLRAYYEGIIWERRGGAVHDRGGPGSGYLAYDRLRRALDCYEKAIELKPGGNEDAILRWNTCVRVLGRDPELKPAPEDTFQPLLE
jgi:tetratricopeptide (TPR) repeat protein